MIIAISSFKHEPFFSSATVPHIKEKSLFSSGGLFILYQAPGEISPAPDGLARLDPEIRLPAASAAILASHGLGAIVSFSIGVFCGRRVNLCLICSSLVNCIPWVTSVFIDVALNELHRYTPSECVHISKPQKNRI